MTLRSSGLRRRIWIAGAVFVLLIAGLAAISARAGIEAELRTRAAVTLAEAGFGWLDVEVEGRDIMLKGAVFTDREKQAAEEALRGIWGVGAVESRLTVAVRDRPYMLSISRSDKRLSIRGSVPTEEARKIVVGLANANFPSVKIDARLRIDPNMAERDRWLTGVGFALVQLRNVSSGNAVLADAELSFEGTAVKPGAYEALMQAFRDETPEGISIAQYRIGMPRAEPFTWKIQIEDDKVVLLGHAPSEMAQATMVYYAQKTFPDKQVIDGTVIATGEPESWWSAARAAVRALGHLSMGSVTLEQTVVKIEGIAKNVGAYEAISAMKGAWPSGYNLETSLRHSAIEPVVRRTNAARAGRNALAPL